MVNNRKKSRRCALLIIWDKVKLPLQSDAREESDLWTAWQLFPLDDDHTGHSKLAEETHPDRQISEEIAEAWRRVHISAWEFEGNIRPTNWTEGSKKKDPAVHETSLVVTLCALSRPSSPYIEEFKPYRRTILIPLLTAPTSHKRPSRK